MNSDIELEVSRRDGVGHYQVHVLRSPAGGDPREAFDLDVDALVRSRPHLEASILSSAVDSRRVTSSAERPVREIGQRLFEALFTRSVYGAYRASLGIAQQQGERLRVVLRFAAPELAALPWEALFDPERQTYLCRQEPMVRRIPAQFNPRAPLQITPPLQVLAIVASPRGLPLLDVEMEQTNLEEALRELTDAGLVSVTWAEPATWQSVHRHLLSGEWHIIHFVGHGDYDDQREEGVLAFVGQDGRPDLVDASRFADLLGEANPTPRLVVLNACSSGESRGEDVLAATAPALVHSGIEAVAAMQFAVTDGAAISFAQGFYTAIANSRAVDEAARSGRIAMLGAAGSLEWLTPVLYLRGEGRQPLVVRPGSSAAEVPEAAVGRSRSGEPATLYDQARGELQAGRYAVAVQLFDRLLDRDPGYRDSLRLRAEARRLADPPTTTIPSVPSVPEQTRRASGGVTTPPAERPAAERPGQHQSVGSATVAGPARPRPEPEPSADRARTLHPPASHESTAPGGAGRGERGRARRGVVVVAAMLLVLGGGSAFLLSRGSQSSTGSRASALSAGTILVPVRVGEKAAAYVRLQALDVDAAGSRLTPWAGSVDILGRGSTSIDTDRFSPNPSPDRTKVAFLVGRRHGLPRPYVADADGSHAHQLTSEVGPCRYAKRPAWNRDGSELAVVCIKGASDDPDGIHVRQRSFSLWILHASGAVDHEVVGWEQGRELGTPSWDWDANLIDTWSASPPGKPLGTHGMPVIVPASAIDRSEPTPVSIERGAYSDPDWSSNGVLLVRDLGPQSRIIVLKDGQVTVLATGPYASAAWSPDHSQVIATRNDGSHHELVILDYLTHRQVATVPVRSGLGAPVWDTR